MNLHDCLADPRRYRRQIERLHEKHLSTRRLYELQQSDVPLASIVLNRTAVARRLARTVGAGRYRLQPARVRTIVTAGKERAVFAYRLTDLLVHGVVAEVIDAAVAPRLSSSLYSYRAGASWWTALGAFAAYVRAHRRSRPDVRQRGLYVIRRDVDSYTDSIPVGPRSPLWPLLRDVLSAAGGATLSAADWELIETVVRPEAFVKAGELFTQYRGVPTGQPISCVLFNLYLRQFDARLDGIPGAFYARYCDDVVFAHPDAEVVRAADACMREALAAVALQFNDAKSQTLYLTGAGRPDPAWPEAKGTTSVPFLGCRVSALATVSLSREKRAQLLRELERRALRTAHILRGRDCDRIGRTVCAVINRALQPRLDFSQQRSAALLRRAVTDRRDLAQLDYGIARVVLRALTGTYDVRGFRRVPYRTMREDWKLRSLLHDRNHWGRGREVAPPAAAS